MTHVQSGPSCTQILAWLGADVVKLEAPAGDVTRKQLRDIPNVDSLYFTMLNCNKRSITLNMNSAEGKRIFADLRPRSDRAHGLRVGRAAANQPAADLRLHQGFWRRTVHPLQGLRSDRAGHG